MTFQAALRLIGLSTCALSLCNAAYAEDTSLQDMQKMMHELQQQVETLKQENQSFKQEISTLKGSAAPKTATKTTSASSTSVTSATQTASNFPAVTYDSDSGFMHFPGTETKFKVGGYVKADAVYDIEDKRAGNGQDFAIPASIPLNGTAEAEADGNFRLHARQTRVNLTSITPTALGDMKLFAEGDLYGTAGSEVTTNGHNFQIRHVYGEVAGFLLGQNWSNWMDIDAYPETFDYVGPAGISLVRQGQVRYAHNLSPNQEISVSAENPAGDFSDDITASNADAFDQVPDFTAKYVYKDTWGHVALKGLGRQIKSYSTVDKDSDLGYGVGVSGKFNVFDKDSFKYQMGYGEGLGRYIFDVAIGMNDGVVTNTGQLELAPVLAGYAAYQHHWNDTMRSNIIYGQTHINNPNTGLDLNENVQSLETNLIWQPHKRIQTGLSYYYGYRELESGKDGDLNRVMWSTWFML
jgi:hypothetical protein